MKVGFSVDINKNDANSGKHKFLIRLSKEMKKNGIIIDNNKPDIFLFLAGQKHCKKARKNILRHLGSTGSQLEARTKRSLMSCS